MSAGRPQAPPAGARTDKSQPSAGRRLVSHPVVGFIPWILFWVIGGPSTWETAAIAALVASVLVLALSVELHPLDLSHLKLLDAATVAFFAAMTVAAIVTSRHDVAVLDRYAQAISSGALGLRDWLNWYLPIALIFVAFRFTSWYPDQVRPAPAGEPRGG